MSLLWDDRTPRAGSEQMAIDRALLDLAIVEGIEIIRLYRWSTETISLGANEAALRHWNRSAIEREGIPVVRRPTGGRAVWHSPSDLTYCVTAPLDHYGGQQPAYRIIHERLAAALHGSGTQASLAPAPDRLPGLQAGSCFDVAIGGEVLIEGRKTIGSAQLVQSNSLLQHGEIARGPRAQALARFARDIQWRPPADDTLLEMSADTLADRIATAWLGHGALLADDDLVTQATGASASHLRHYCDPEWTWRR